MEKDHRYEVFDRSPSCQTQPKALKMINEMKNKERIKDTMDSPGTDCQTNPSRSSLIGGNIYSMDCSIIQPGIIWSEVS